MRTRARLVCTAAAVAALVHAGPLLAQTQAPPPSTAPSGLPTEEDVGQDSAPQEIIVTGLRRSIETSQELKRQSEGIVDAITAEDIGRLPDITASAALARVTGVQVNRAAGEAAQVQVRGLPDITTTYNGREIFTAEGRFVQIQDFPAGSVSALEVYKSSTANLIEGGIGGQVNVRSRRPFDFDGLEVFGAINGVHTDQYGAIDWNGNILISNRWDTAIGEIGILVNAAYTQLRHLDSTREQSLVAGVGTTASGQEFRYPDATALFYGSGRRWRPSATATVQWKPTPELEIYADGLFQGFRSRDTNRFLFVPLFGNVELSNVVVGPDGRASSLTASYPNAIDFRPDGWSGRVQAKTDTYHVAGGAIYTNEGLRLSADIAYTDSTFTLRNLNIDHAFAFSPVRDVEFDAPRGDGGPSFSFRDFDVLDPNNYLYRGLFQEYLVAEGDDIQARLDVEYDFGEDSILRRIQAGFRFDDRGAGRRRGDRYDGEPFPFPRSLASTGVLLESVRPGFAGDTVARFTTYLQPNGRSVWENQAALRAFAGAPEGFPDFDPTQRFSADERSYTGYGQVKYGFDLGTVAVDGNIGLRAVRTETTVNGTQRVDISAPGQQPVFDFTPISATNSYWDYLPNASARLVLLPDVQMRLAYTQTRTRPAFGDLNPGFTLAQPPTICVADPLIPESGPDNPNCIRDFFGGNPNLQPLTSTNYDVSVEWYFARAGSLTAAVFRRDLNNFISRVVVDSVDQTFGRIRSNLPFNGGDGRIQGVELAFTGFLDIASLPEWARGFGFQANGTYIDAKSELATVLQDNLPESRRGSSPRLAGVSEFAYNLVAIYERPQFSARLAYNYRSNFVDSYGRIFDPGIGGDGPTLPLMQRGRGVLDFSATVTPVPAVTIAFDATNLLGEPIQRDREFEEGLSFPRQVIYLERVYSLGVRFRF